MCYEQKVKSLIDCFSAGAYFGGYEQSVVQIVHSQR